MKVRHVRIEGFRGIKVLDWTVKSSTACLIGPGNSCKTTVLDAIALALSPRWNLSFTDSDFFGCSAENGLAIAITVGELPATLRDMNKFGYYMRGWSPEDGLADEPTDGKEEVLTIQLKVDNTLEPAWKVITERNPEGKSISAHDRETLGAFQLGGSYFDRELSWTRNSVLTRFTSTNRETAGVLSRLHRSLRQGIQLSDMQDLHRAARKVQESSAHFGVKPETEFQPFLDTQSYGSISLHDGLIPVRQSGVGDRRLLTIALQHIGVVDGGILLVDEIEQGLEPHRLRNLIRLLRSESSQSDQTTQDTVAGQTFLTTHSPVALSELRPGEIHIVRRCSDGTLIVEEVPEDIVKHVKKVPEAILARKIIVCEGYAEYALSRILDPDLDNPSEPTLAYSGAIPVVPTGGGGRTESAAVAEAFAKLGFQVAYFGDSDKPLNPTAQELAVHGVEVVLWAGNVSTEQRVFLDLPWQGIVDLYSEVVDLRGAHAVIDKVETVNNLPHKQLKPDLNEWLDYYDVARIRQFLANASITGSQQWFKSLHMAEKLAGVVKKYLGEIAECDLGAKLTTLKTWTHE